MVCKIANARACNWFRKNFRTPNLEPDLGFSIRMVGMFPFLLHLEGDREGGVGRYGYSFCQYSMCLNGSIRTSNNFSRSAAVSKLWLSLASFL
jgi:hypothetical protein